MLEPGDVLLLPVDEARAVALRVVARRGDERCVLLTRWVGPRRVTRPTLERARRVRELQPLEHHELRRPLLGGWVRGEAPVRPAARIAAEPVEVLHPQDWVRSASKSPALALRVVPRLSWPQLADEARRQWRWTHDRRALQAEEAAKRAAGQGALAAALAATRSAETPASLVRARFLEPWREEKPRALYRAAVAVLREAAKALHREGPASARAVLRRAIAGVRELDAQWDLDEADLDDLHFELRRLARAAGTELDAA